jgi:hypothetical protein
MQSFPRCGLSRPFWTFLSYRYFHLYWIFGTVYNRKYLAAYTVCSQGTQIDKNQLGPAASEDPVPFMQKWGLGVFAVLIAGIIAVASINR